MENRVVGVVCECGQFVASGHRVDWCKFCRAIFVRGAPCAIVSIRATLNAGGVRITPEIDFEGTWEDGARERVRAAVEGVEATRRARDAGER